MGNNENKLKLLIKTLGEERVKLNEPLKYHTFSKLGGSAEGFFIATNQQELVQILNLAYDLKLPFFIFGSGTKMLISDNSVSGLIIKNRTGAIKIGGIKGKVGKVGIGIEEALVEVDSGVSLGKLNEFLREQNLREIEGFSSMVATIGGSILLDPVLGDLVTSVKIWDKGGLFDASVGKINRAEIILSVVLKVRAKI